MNATVNPEHAEASDCHFEYGTSEAAYTSSVPCSQAPGSGVAPVSVSAPLTGLSPVTTYHYRIVATNSHGTSYGSDRTFKTTLHNLPVITSISPERGPEAGGTEVTIRGSEFEETEAVKFGSTNAASFTVHSSELITAVSPKGVGPVDVTVTTASGTSHQSQSDQFTFALAPTIRKLAPKKGSETGGTTVLITGTNLTEATIVKFGSMTATGVKVNSATSVTAISPIGSAGPVDVTVTTRYGGTSAVSRKDRFTYKKARKARHPTGPEERGQGEFGQSVALSADGDTALIGSPHDNAKVSRDPGIGAAWVFTRSGSTWTQQGPKLAAGGEIGEGGFGESVALSSDGNTALVGAPRDNSNEGAAWVFTRSGSTWTQQGPMLVDSARSRNAWFGFAVALSGDGNTALIAGSRGAWVFTRSGSTWTQQAEMPSLGGGSAALSSDGNTALLGGGFLLTRSGSTWTEQRQLVSEEGERGSTVALSGDGNTALVGNISAANGNPEFGNFGAAWAFARSGSVWSQQGPRFTGGGEVGRGLFGRGLAVSSDGGTALIGGYEDNEKLGAAWVFTRSGESWAQQGPKLTGAGEAGRGGFGLGAALSSDGNTALIGGPWDNELHGAAWVFTRSGSTWTQQGEKLTGVGLQGSRSSNQLKARSKYK
jgi:hypothetical protein